MEILEVKHVKKVYNTRLGGRQCIALRDVSFEVDAGEFTAIMGASGSGKTTLVNLIPRFYDVSAGRVLVDGTDVRQWDPKALRARIGVAPQRAALFAGTIRDNLRWGKRDATDEELWQALKTAQAEQTVLAKPGGLDEPVRQGGRNFSGGQRQRLTIARALTRQPEILILDDSASALDYATDAALRKALRELPGGVTVFVVSQRVSAIRHADLILALDDGRLAGMGTHEELLRDCAVYREICQSQSAGEVA